MKIESRILLACLLLTSQSAFARSQTELEQKYKPLQGSEWAKANPGKLPYSRCRIESSMWRGVAPHSEFQLALISSGPDAGQDGKSLYLTCVAKELGLAYQVPVLFDTPSLNFGIYADWIETTILSNRTKVVKLHQKTLHSAFGKYCGINAGIGIVISGVSGSRTSNENGVGIRTKDFKFGNVLEFGRANFKLEPKAYVSQGECHNPFILINGDTGASRDVAKDCAANDAHSPYTTPTMLDLTHMGELEFIKVKK